MNRFQQLIGAGGTGALLLGLSLVTAGPAHAATLSCGASITVSTALTSDIGPCASDGLEVTGSNLTLNLNGHRIIGNADPNAALIGVHVTGSNVTVKGGTVSGFDSGVFLDTSTQDTVTGMLLTNNAGADPTGTYGEGLQIFLGGGHVVSGNRVIHNGPFAGIDAYQTSNNTFDHNEVLNNNVVFPGLTSQDIGIWLVNLDPSLPNGDSNNSVTNNVVTGSGLDGVQVSRFTNSNRVVNNQVLNNGFGQVAGDPNPHRDGDGIVIYGNGNLVQNNTVTHSAANGIRISFSANHLGTPVGGQDNRIIGNRAVTSGMGLYSQGAGFDLTDENTAPPCDNNTWTANIHRTMNQACVASH